MEEMAANVKRLEAALDRAEAHASQIEVERNNARSERDAALLTARKAADFLGVADEHLVAEARLMRVVAKQFSEACEIGQRYLRDEVDVGNNVFSAIPKVVRQRDEARSEAARLKAALATSEAARLELAIQCGRIADLRKRASDEASQLERARNDAILEIARLRAILDGRPAKEAADE